MKRIVVGIVLFLAAASASGAHEISQTVTRGNAVVIELKEDGNLPFGHEPFEIYRKGEEKPFQTGTTDALGRIVFLPDRQATWRVRAFSEDGHGTDFTIDAGPGETEEIRAGDPTRPAKIVFGVVTILLVFMIALRVVRRRLS
jgi:nickel transport protein